MMRILSVYSATEDDLPDACAYCGEQIEVGDDVFDVYGDLYHAECWQIVVDTGESEVDDLADTPSLPD